MSELKLDAHETATFKLNRGNSGFYRTVYNASHLQVMANQIKTAILNRSDCLGILVDVTDAAKAGKLDAAEVLNFMKAYKNEDDNAGMLLLEHWGIRSVMDDDGVRDAMKPMVRTLVATQVKRLGWKPEPQQNRTDRLLRPTMLGMASARMSLRLWRIKERFAEMHDPSEVKRS